MHLFEHGGNIHKAKQQRQDAAVELIDFSANINPLGPPEWFRPLISSCLEDLVHYPDPDNSSFVAAVAGHTSLSESQVVVGNGTTELLYALMRTVPAQRVLVPVPSYVDYVRAAKLGGHPVEYFEILEQDGFQLDLSRLDSQVKKGDLVIIATPNNPTGICPDRAQLLELCRKHPESWFLFDEAFLDFLSVPAAEAGGADSCQAVATLGGQAENILTINSMTKFYGLPGLRLGYGLFSTELAAKIKEQLPPWTVNSLAQAVGEKALGDSFYQQQTRENCNRLRRDLYTGLVAIDELQVFPGTANYLFMKILADAKREQGDSGKLAEFCLQRGIMIRRCDNYRGVNQSQRFVRVAVRTAEENEKLLEVLGDYFQRPGRVGSKKVRRARSIMFQGTCSDAGKSILTAAMCRILRQDGVRVAPFKAQNMSLNSFVTLSGDEMGRAQVVQAQAAGLDPDCRMNPILLKPNSDTGSQIIVSGKPVGNMSVLEYNDYKPVAWKAACRSYDELAAEYDAVVLEGAGSPGEVNLKADDIVNMRMGRYAQAPVLLVGDIDRGGVYASFVGIMEVLAEWERKLIRGFIVNKFRGQASLLESAHEYVQLHTGRPVLGVIPHLANLGLPEEDSVSFKKGSFNKAANRDGIVLALVNLPHISNFTDVEPFLEEPDVSLRMVENVGELEGADAIILPGSKNVIHDLKFLNEKGFAGHILRQVERGCELVGICGGYQMLGRVIHDPYEIESPDGSITGLGYLDMETVIEKSKQLTRKQGTHLYSGQPVYGYEIHHGISTAAPQPLMRFADNSVCGRGNDNHTIWGSYLHGIFDSDPFRRWFIDRLRVKRGLAPIGEILAPYNLELAFDRLAETVRANIDIDQLYRLMKL